ncbi:MAG: glycosyltransferase [Candidatus Bipolaricaulaceae bacterium]
MAAWVSMLFLALGIEALYQRHLWLLFAVSVVVSQEVRARGRAALGGQRPLRVLVATTVAGTVQAFLLPHIARLKERGVEVEVACNTRNRAVTGRIRDHGVVVHHLPLRRQPLSWGNLRGFFRSVKLIRRGGYTAVHVHTPVAGFLGRLAARLGDPRAVTLYTAHGFHFHPGRSWLGNLPFLALERLAGRWTDYLMVINRQDQAAARRSTSCNMPPAGRRQGPRTSRCGSGTSSGAEGAWCRYSRSRSAGAGR